jgi:hypothetical protein
MELALLGRLSRSLAERRGGFALPFAITPKYFERGANSTQALTNRLHPEGMRVKAGAVSPIKLMRDPPP